MHCAAHCFGASAAARLARARARSCTQQQARAPSPSPAAARRTTGAAGRGPAPSPKRPPIASYSPGGLGAPGSRAGRRGNPRRLAQGFCVTATRCFWTGAGPGAAGPPAPPRRLATPRTRAPQRALVFCLGPWPECHRPARAGAPPAAGARGLDAATVTRAHALPSLAATAPLAERQRRSCRPANNPHAPLPCPELQGRTPPTQDAPATPNPRPRPHTRCGGRAPGGPASAPLRCPGGFWRAGARVALAAPPSRSPWPLCDPKPCSVRKGLSAPLPLPQRRPRASLHVPPSPRGPSPPPPPATRHAPCFARLSLWRHAFCVPDPVFERAPAKRPPSAAPPQTRGAAGRAGGPRHSPAGARPAPAAILRPHPGRASFAGAAPRPRSGTASRRGPQRAAALLPRPPPRADRPCSRPSAPPGPA
jgi:hypothetical protein